MGTSVSVDTDALARAAGTVNGLAVRVGNLADGHGPALVLQRAADEVHGSATSGVLHELPATLIAVVSGLEAALTALAQGLTNVGHAYERTDSSMAAAAAGLDSGRGPR